MKTNTSIAPTPTAAEQARQNLATAKDCRDTYAASLAAALSALEDYEDRRRSGDASVSPAEVREARDDVEHWTVLQSAAEAAVARAERALVPEETGLADALAPAVGAALRLPVTVHNSKPDMPSTVTAPQVFLVQSKATAYNTITGTLSGDLDLLYVRNAFHSRPDLAKLERVLEGRKHGHHGVTIISQGERVDGDLIVDSLRISVAYAAPGVPVITPNSGDLFHVLGFGRLIHSDLYANVGFSGAALTGVSIGSGVAGARQAEVVHVTHEKPSVVSDNTGSDGIRHRILEVTVSVAPTRGNPWSPDDLRDKVRSAVESQEGRFVASLGRVASVKILRVDPTESGKGRSVTARFDFLSQVAL